MKRFVFLFAASALVSALLDRATAQTVLTVNGPAVLVSEHTGPPAICGYPTGPIVGGFPYAGPFPPCGVLPGPFALGPPSVGDCASDITADTVWVTDGALIAEYTSLGMAIRNFPVPPGLVFPGPIVGMGFDTGPGVLWITNGPLVAGIIPPPVPGCVLPAIAVPAFLSPSPAPLTDISWDPGSGSLWGCDAGGFVTNFFPGGALTPFGVFPVAPAPCLLGPLTGIAYDTATPLFTGGPPTVYVTDGAIIEKVIPGGAPAPPTFHTPFPCYPVPFAPPPAGMAYTLAPIAYGIGTDPAALPLPVMGATGQSATPSGPMTITLASAAPFPGTMAGLFYSFGLACPAIPFLGGNLLYLMPPLFGPIGPFPVPAAGTVTFGPFGLPAGLPIGASIYMQWIIAKGGGGFQVSNAIEFTFGLP